MITKVTTELLKSVDLDTFVLGISDIAGMSFSNMRSITKYITDSVKPNSCIDFFFALEGTTITGCGAIKKREEFLYYCIKSHKIQVLKNVLEFCSLYVLPRARGSSLGKNLFEARLNAISSYEYTDIVLEVRAEYNGDIPVVEQFNRNCWVVAPRMDYTKSDLASSLIYEEVSVDPNAHSIGLNAQISGFHVVGINAYDNGPVYFKSVWEV